LNSNLLSSKATLDELCSDYMKESLLIAVIAKFDEFMKFVGVALASHFTSYLSRCLLWVLSITYVPLLAPLLKARVYDCD
jgi:hypothetical protein